MSNSASGEARPEITGPNTASSINQTTQTRTASMCGLFPIGSLNKATNSGTNGLERPRGEANPETTGPKIASSINQTTQTPKAALCVMFPIGTLKNPRTDEKVPMSLRALGVMRLILPGCIYSKEYLDELADLRAQYEINSEVVPQPTYYTTPSGCSTGGRHIVTQTTKGPGFKCVKCNRTPLDVPTHLHSREKVMSLKGVQPDVMVGGGDLDF